MNEGFAERNSGVRAGIAPHNEHYYADVGAIWTLGRLI